MDLTLSPARMKHAPHPEYPERAIRRGLEGTVRLAAEVGTDGKVRKVYLLESSGSGLLDDASIATVRTWTFRPARVNGRPVPCTVRIRPIRFRFD